LVDAGWNVFSLCSNHTYDHGTEGIRQTLSFWKSMQENSSPEEKICCTGLWEYGTEYDIPIFTCKGKKLAFLTYTYGTNNIETPADSPAHVIYLEEEGLMAYQIQLAREQADAVIVSLHWGEEYNHEETEDQRALAQRVADMGADLIVGGHPHVVEGAQMLTAADGRKVFCAYSLGNFLCAQNSMPNPDAMIGLLLSCTFRFTKEGLTVEDHALIPILSDYGENYEDDHVVLYSDYSEEEALEHGMRTMYGFTEFDYDYIRRMLTDVVGEEYLQLP
jgi:poly-gamma-glutamate synthesis protein (capsule biosynthesis protein)